jgi:hypothetical protein
MATVVVMVTTRALADAFVPGCSKLFALHEVSQASRCWRQQRGLDTQAQKLENLLSAYVWYMQWYKRLKPQRTKDVHSSRSEQPTQESPLRPVLHAVRTT